jgi:hypothetical protein
LHCVVLCSAVIFRIVQMRLRQVRSTVLHFASFIVEIESHSLTQLALFFTMNSLTKVSPLKVIHCVTVHYKPLTCYYDIKTQGIQTTNNSLIVYKMIYRRCFTCCASQLKIKFFFLQLCFHVLSNVDQSKSKRR